MGTMQGCAKQHRRVPTGAETHEIDMDSSPVRTAWQTNGRKASISCSVLSERPMVWCRMWFVPLSLELMPPVICTNKLFEVTHVHVVQQAAGMQQLGLSVRR